MMRRTLRINAAPKSAFVPSSFTTRMPVANFPTVAPKTPSISVK